MPPLNHLSIPTFSTLYVYRLSTSRMWRTTRSSCARLTVRSTTTTSSHHRHWRRRMRRYNTHFAFVLPVCLCRTLTNTPRGLIAPQQEKVKKESEKAKSKARKERADEEESGEEEEEVGRTRCRHQQTSHAHFNQYEHTFTVRSYLPKKNI